MRLWHEEDRRALQLRAYYAVLNEDPEVQADLKVLAERVTGLLHPRDAIFLTYEILPELIAFP